MAKVTFNSSGTWKVPPGVTQITVECYGGGGGGGGAGGSPFEWGGGGGCGGDYTTITLDVEEGQLIPVHVGAGGAGGAENAPGENGGETWCKHRNVIRAQGGLGGLPGSNDYGPGYTSGAPHDNWPSDTAIWADLGGGGNFQVADSGGGGGSASGDATGLSTPPGEGRPDGTGYGGATTGDGGHGGVGGYWNDQPTTAGQVPGGGGGAGGSPVLVRTFICTNVAYSTAEPHYLTSEVSESGRAPDADPTTVAMDAAYSVVPALTFHDVVVWDDMRTIITCPTGAAFAALVVSQETGIGAYHSGGTGIWVTTAPRPGETPPPSGQLVAHFQVPPGGMVTGTGTFFVVDDRGLASPQARFTVTVTRRT